MNERVSIATCKQLVWSTRIGRNMPIWITTSTTSNAYLVMSVKNTVHRYLTSHHRQHTTPAHADLQVSQWHDVVCGSPRKTLTDVTIMSQPLAPYSRALRVWKGSAKTQCRYCTRPWRMGQVLSARRVPLYSFHTLCDKSISLSPSKQPPVLTFPHASNSSTICCLECRNGIVVDALRTSTSYFDVGWTAFAQQTSDGSMPWIPEQILGIGEDSSFTDRLMMERWRRHCTKFIREDIKEKVIHGSPSRIYRDMLVW
jgi:hypothetical protein